jgi:hypothetical protein
MTGSASLVTRKMKKIEIRDSNQEHSTSSLNISSLTVFTTYPLALLYNRPRSSPIFDVISFM